MPGPVISGQPEGLLRHQGEDMTARAGGKSDCLVRERDRNDSVRVHPCLHPAKRFESRPQRRVVLRVSVHVRQLDRASVLVGIAFGQPGHGDDEHPPRGGLVKEPPPVELVLAVHLARAATPTRKYPPFYVGMHVSLLLFCGAPEWVICSVGSLPAPAGISEAV